MHLYITTRGIKHCVDNFVDKMQQVFFPYYWPGQDDIHGVQLAMRPIQLWEIVVPEQGMQTLINSLWTKQEYETMRFKKQLWLLRKSLGAQKMPPMLPGNRPIKEITENKKYVAIYPIGIKPDEYDPNDQHENL